MNKKTRLRRKQRKDCQKEGMNVEPRIDFLQYLDTDVSIHILSCLDDPMDLIRASGVSSSWRRFLTENGLAKKLCLTRFPQLSNIVDIAKMSDDRVVKRNFNTGNLVKKTNFEWGFLEEHVVYSYLLYALMTRLWVFRGAPLHVTCQLDRCFGRDSCSLSTEHNDATKPETFLYKADAGCLIITEIDIKPLKDFLQSGKYSAKSIRVRVGYDSNDDGMVWTYTSPELPMMMQESIFKLPEPIICLDRCLQVELWGWDRKKQRDGLSCTDWSHPKWGHRVPNVLGHKLQPAFDIERLDTDNGKLLLKYNHTRLLYLMHTCNSSLLKWWHGRQSK